MMRSLFSGVSGLKNHQTRMDVIGNNISNVNTTGFKSSRVTFTDMLSQNLSGASSPNDNIGGTNPKQIGLGSAVGAVDLLFTNGSVQSTGVNTDLALSSSNALFILNTGSGTAYTRNGDFQFDADGNYVQAGNGYYVQGWMANEGSIDTGAQVTNITIPSGKTMAPVASMVANYTNNLNAEIPTISQMVQVTESTSGSVKTTTTTTVNADEVKINVVTVDSSTTPPTRSETESTAANPTPPGTALNASDGPITLTLSDGSKLTQTEGQFTNGQSTPVVTTLSVYDSLGSVHNVTVYFTLTDAEQDTWKVALSTTGEDPSTATWTEPDGSKTTVEMPVVTLKFDSNGVYETGSGNASLMMKNGSSTPQTINLNFSQLTQYSSSTTIAGKADGNAAGVLSSISIDKTGTITGTYTNGMKQTEAQVALQRFTNPGGLNKIGESLYEDSNNSGKSGEPSTAAALGATITPSALEMSNVDVANEFTDMIITQRGFQTNSKIITVSDEMLETIVNMKR
ncbi:MAG: flagellar hook protein FlgE [Selenomonadaceae bacterium]|nr:flagellar hook protein FlgE [Selenomonadaceae bacterium]